MAVSVKVIFKDIFNMDGNLEPGSNGMGKAGSKGGCCLICSLMLL